MKQEAGVHFTGKLIENCIKCIYETNGNWSYDLSAFYTLYCDYGKLNVVKKDLAYCYMFDKIESFNCEYFQIANEGGKLYSATLTDEDFPITIRSPQNGDKIVLRFGTKKLNRWFIDRKISHKQRKCWPVIVNRVGNVILVPEIGCDIAHFTNKPNLFVLK